VRESGTDDSAGQSTKPLRSPIPRDRTTPSSRLAAPTQHAHQSAAAPVLSFTQGTTHARLVAMQASCFWTVQPTGCGVLCKATPSRCTPHVGGNARPARSLLLRSSLAWPVPRRRGGCHATRPAAARDDSAEAPEGYVEASVATVQLNKETVRRALRGTFLVCFNNSLLPFSHAVSCASAGAGHLPACHFRRRPARPVAARLRWCVSSLRDFW
jgi:hypothetical protein